MKIRYQIMIAAFSSLTCISAMAQGGGKAEPNRIEFKRGTTSTTINGTLRSDEQAEYVFAARKGQKLKILVNSVPRDSCIFDLHGPENTDLGFAMYDYADTLSATGEYLLFVLRPTESKGRSRYKLIITIR